MNKKTILITLILTVPLLLSAATPAINTPGMAIPQNMAAQPARPVVAPAIIHPQPMAQPAPIGAAVTPVTMPTPPVAVQTPAVTPAPAQPMPTPTMAQQPMTSSTGQQHGSTNLSYENLTAIGLTAGTSHELDALDTAVERYVVQAPGYVSYLHSEDQGIGKPALYSLVAPKNAKAGTFIVFKGEGEGLHPLKMEPAFKVTVTAATGPVTNDLPDFKEMVKEAWFKQEEAEERYFTDMKERFEQFREEIRSIWFNVSIADENFEEQYKKEKGSIKTVSKKLLRMTIGEEKSLGTGASGSISSLNPKIVSGKMGSVKKGTSYLWELQITAHEAGSTQITYTLDGITYIVPIVVETAKTTTHSLQTLKKPGEQTEGKEEDTEEVSEEGTDESEDETVTLSQQHDEDAMA